MNIELSQKAREIFQKEAKEKEKFVLINMVKYDCNGPVLSVSLKRDSKGYDIIEHEGINFLIDNEEKKMFSGVAIDYESDGLNEGFIVRPLDNLMGMCFVKEDK